jgi:hypothetical protein
MANPDALRYTRIPLTHGSGALPAVGFGTLIPDLLATKQATKIALEAGFRHLDCAERLVGRGRVKPSLNIAPRVRDRRRRRPRKGALPPV